MKPLITLLIALPLLSATAIADLSEGNRAYFDGDYDIALRELTPLATENNPRAQYLLGRMYRDGDGAPQNVVEAYHLFSNAAQNGYPEAQFALGQLYEKGRGVPSDFQQAIDWYYSAAKQGLADANYALGQIYEEGKGVPRDESRALDWYSLAAVQNHALAQFKLGSFYQYGKGVPRSPLKAYQWYYLAAKRGVFQASIEMDKLSANLTSTDIDLAQQRAEGWMARQSLAH